MAATLEILIHDGVVTVLLFMCVVSLMVIDLHEPCPKVKIKQSKAIKSKQTAAVSVPADGC